MDVGHQLEVSALGLIWPFCLQRGLVLLLAGALDFRGETPSLLTYTDVSTGFGSHIETVMGLFNRKKRQDSDSADSSENKKEKGSWRRPASLSLLPLFFAQYLT